MTLNNWMMHCVNEIISSIWDKAAYLYSNAVCIISYRNYEACRCTPLYSIIWFDWKIESIEKIPLNYAMKWSPKMFSKYGVFNEWFTKMASLPPLKSWPNFQRSWFINVVYTKGMKSIYIGMNANNNDFGCKFKHLDNVARYTKISWL